MVTFKITFEFSTEKDVRIEQVKEWASYHLYGGHLQLSHPLADDDIDADYDSIRVERL